MTACSPVQSLRVPPCAVSSVGQSNCLLSNRSLVRIQYGAPCGHRIMAITSAFQADDAGSIPAGRSIRGLWGLYVEYFSALPFIGKNKHTTTIYAGISNDSYWFSRNLFIYLLYFCR